MALQSREQGWTPPLSAWTRRLAGWAQTQSAPASSGAQTRRVPMLAYPSAAKQHPQQQRFVVVKPKSQRGLRSCLAVVAAAGLCLCVLAAVGAAVALMVSMSHGCPDAEMLQRKWRQAEDRADRLDIELSELKRKHRSLEDDFRDLAIASRSGNAATQAATTPQSREQDVSALQRLAKCRASVEASTEAIRELREHNADLNKQVTRLQREVKDAVKDVDDCERSLGDCKRRSGM